MHHFPPNLLLDETTNSYIIDTKAKQAEPCEMSLMNGYVRLEMII